VAIRFVVVHDQDAHITQDHRVARDNCSHRIDLQPKVCCEMESAALTKLAFDPDLSFHEFLHPGAKMVNPSPVPPNVLKWAL
jgi:hypothetical protein